jgi:hypothetical protein
MEWLQVNFISLVNVIVIDVVLAGALDMIYDGSREVACATGKGVWCAPDLPSLLRGLTR